tara:strand:+ start:2492 stop:3265 length:774 start_codon:yes stop_codon:yes gene_type:complete
LRLIIGGDSKIGSAIANHWSSKGYNIHYSTRNKNLVSYKRPFLNLEQVGAFDFTKYQKIVVCSAQTNLSECELFPRESQKINVDSVKKILEMSCASDQVILLSTNQVFDGAKPYRRIYDTKKPLNSYGKQKSQMEDLALLHHNSCILRLSKVITPMDNLTNDWIKNLELGRNIEVFDDFFMSPTPIKKVLLKIDKLILNNSKGIFHCEGEEDISYFSFAKEIAESHNLDTSLIKPVSYLSSDKIKYRVPKYTSLLEG